MSLKIQQSIATRVLGFDSRDEVSAGSVWLQKEARLDSRRRLQPKPSTGTMLFSEHERLIGCR